MGCRPSTQTPRKPDLQQHKDESRENACAADNTDMADKLPDPLPPAPTDPRCPLDARQVFKLKKSWKGIKRCMEATGVEMFIRMFKKNDEIRKLFKHFKDISSHEDLRVDEMLEKHALVVMNIFDEAVNNIDNVDYVLNLLKTTGNMHAGLSQFQAQLFWAIEEPFLQAVKITLEDRYSDNMDKIYRITIKFILEKLVNASQSSNDVS